VVYKFQGQDYTNGGKKKIQTKQQLLCGGLQISQKDISATQNITQVGNIALMRRLQLLIYRNNGAVNRNLFLKLLELKIENQHSVAFPHKECKKEVFKELHSARPPGIHISPEYLKHKNILGDIKGVDEIKVSGVVVLQHFTPC
uniref:Uncharacterized protein n=1 Tax=Neolamprologus brichardi TaxID=32507 RepID=A0A3Q4I2U0_NEOBR